MPAHLPRYEKLIQLLKEKLSDGTFKIGDRFYSQNELMKKYGLSFATVTRSMNELEQQGFLSREQGRGTFVRAKPDSAGASAAQPRSISAFLPWDIRNPSHVSSQRLYAGIEASLPPNWSLKLVPFAEDPAQLERYLFARDRLDGLLIAFPAESHLPIVRRIGRMYPTVIVGHALSDPTISSVFVNNRIGAEQAVNYLIRQGHRNIAMIAAGSETSETRERIDGYRAALAHAEIPFRESLVGNTSLMEMNGYGALLDLMDRNSDIDTTAVFVSSDVSAIGAFSAARSMKRRIPDDLSFVGFEDIDAAASFVPPLTTMHVPLDEMSARAIDVLSRMIDHQAHAEKIELQATLVERGSVRTITAANTGA